MLIKSLAAFEAVARELDAEDPLKEYRDAFVIADPELIYLDGNSLGRLPKKTLEVLRQTTDDWGAQLVGQWKDWFDLPRRIGGKIARVIGAQPDEVVVCDSTSVNLFKLTVAALQLQKDRGKVVTDDANFPSDVYVTVGAAVLTAKTAFELVEAEAHPEEASHQVEKALDGDTALLSLSHTLFKSGCVYDMRRLTGAAHEAGVLALWDLSHSVGAVPVDLNGGDVDLAVGCGYKYLNGGPGAPAFLYVRRELQERLRSPIWGWFGQRDPFEFALDYQPAAGIDRFLAGTPPILSLAALEPGVDLVLEAGIEAIRAKSAKQTELLIDLADTFLAPLGFTVMTPRDPAARGSHVALVHPEAWRINQALIREMNVIPDFRAPDVLRLGVSPLYTTFVELVEAVKRIARVVDDKRYEAYSSERAGVT